MMWPLLTPTCCLPRCCTEHRGVFDSAWQRLAAATDWAALAAAQPGSTEAEFRAQVGWVGNVQPGL